MSEIYGDSHARLRCYGDNTTAVQDYNEGYSKAMRHLKKHHGVSIGIISDAADRDDTEIISEPTAVNTSDIFTKGLGGIKHEHHSAGLGLSGFKARL
jgi:hypothetical protein